MSERGRARADGLDSLSVTVLGSGTCVPLAGRGASGYLVRAGGANILVDAGSGTLTRLAQLGLCHRDIGFVLVSHLHPDHSLDLAALLHANGATPGYSRSSPLAIAGCRGLSALLDKLIEAYDCIRPEGYALEIRELGEEEMSLPAGIELTARLNGHTEESLSFRFNYEGRSLVYSGDASARGGLAELARGADLLVCECSLPDAMAVPDHLCPAEVGKIAREAGVGRVILTHLYPQALESGAREEVEQVFGGPVGLAYDGFTALV
ncbi:MBL fold metallo-hydrolase [bacterium]|nr:MBL fold metallo-hydrolase [bacterium]